MTRILIMSRDHQFFRILQSGLERLGFYVSSTLVGDHHCSKTDVVLIDDGFFESDFLVNCHIVKYRSRAVMIVMGECHNENVILKGMTSFIDDYVLKPFDFSELEMLINKQLKRKNLLENLLQM